ncbi:hypothetical protein RUM8411_01600 [Ruegeria meonggei]|uniref:Uncharacterized protein n=1 Tax=Ruegeria meonggei TaxID=1446476 RepID=A0A1X6Z187_9RHOB|nr:hypothetical protein RUM8411_01600 [Ruegeria meonggei]
MACFTEVKGEPWVSVARNTRVLVRFPSRYTFGTIVG